MNKTDLIQQVVIFYDLINRLIMGYKLEKWMSLDITIAQLKSILYINSKGKVNFKELAGALNVSPSVVTGIVDRLTSQEIISRIANTGDRRVQWLVITEKGKNLINDIKQDTTNEMSKILGKMSDEDISALFQGFTALFKTAGTYLQDKNKMTAATANSKAV
jgi:DNA-binding MarR family transcriptional regulator